MVRGENCAVRDINETGRRRGLEARIHRSSAFGPSPSIPNTPLFGFSSVLLLFAPHARPCEPTCYPDDSFGHAKNKIATWLPFSERFDGLQGRGDGDGASSSAQTTSVRQACAIGSKVLSAIQNRLPSAVRARLKRRRRPTRR